MKKTNYFFLIGSDKFLLHEEPLEEIFRERVNHYVMTNKYVDFWILNQPHFLKALLTKKESFLKLDGQNKSKISSLKELETVNLENCFTIVSTNETFIVWLKLRLNNVWVGQFSAPLEGVTSPLLSNI